MSYFIYFHSIAHFFMLLTVMILLMTKGNNKDMEKNHIGKQIYGYEYVVQYCVSQFEKFIKYYKMLPIILALTYLI